MSLARTTGLIVATVALSVITNRSFAQPPPDRDDRSTVVGGATQDVEGTEVYTRGPLHEAYAQPQFSEPQPGPVIEKRPPEPINEQPPDQRPDGNDVVWIPGYWEWDEELNDFLWISGIWRHAPPASRWVPGYWHEVEGGFQRVSGMWVSDSTEEIAYLPEPPPSREEGPVGTAPGDDYFWIPGNWNYASTGYQWQSGYWSPFYEDWIWVPAHYVATPLGFVAVPGHWDYPLDDRGLVFAPVHFAQWTAVPFTPTVVVNTWQNFFVNLFVNPRHRCYAFGDHYGSVWRNAGVIPWHDFHGRRRGYDPLFAYYRHVHGDAFPRRLQGWTDFYSRNPDRRPPATWKRYRDYQRDHRDDDQIASLGPLTVNLAEVGKKSRALPFDLTRLTSNERSRFADHGRLWRDLARERDSFERDRRDRDPADRADRSPRRSFRLPRDILTQADRERLQRDVDPRGDDDGRREGEFPRGRDPRRDIGRDNDRRDGDDRRENEDRRDDDARRDRDALRPGVLPPRDDEDRDRNRPGRDDRPTPRDDRDGRFQRPGVLPGTPGGRNEDRRNDEDVVPRYPGQRDDDSRDFRPGRRSLGRPEGTRANPNAPGGDRQPEGLPDRTPDRPRIPQPRPDERDDRPAARPMPDIRPQQPTPRQPNPDPGDRTGRPRVTTPERDLTPRNPASRPTTPGAGLRPQQTPRSTAPRSTAPQIGPTVPRLRTPEPNTRSSQRVPIPSTGTLPGRSFGNDGLRPDATRSPRNNLGAPNPTIRPDRPSTSTFPSLAPRSNLPSGLSPAGSGDRSPGRPSTGIGPRTVPRPQSIPQPRTVPRPQTLPQTSPRPQIAPQRQAVPRPQANPGSQGRGNVPLGRGGHQGKRGRG